MIKSLVLSLVTFTVAVVAAGIVVLQSTDTSFSSPVALQSLVSTAM